MTGEIRFGTDGWRGVIGRDFTFANVARVGVAVARHLQDPQRGELPVYREWGVPLRPAEAGILVGYDTRFLSRAFALELARAVQSQGVPVWLTPEPVPTPALSLAVVAERRAGGVMITASHNPPEYNGVKFKPEYGGSATEDITRRLEALLPPHAPDLAAAHVPLHAIREAYLEKVKKEVDLGLIRRAPLFPVVDAMYGSAQGYLRAVLRELRLPHVAVRHGQDPLFGGKKPEPIEENMGPLRAVVRGLRGRTRGRILVGLVTDGDGDRAAAMDERGEFLNTHRTAALLLWHLFRHRGLRGPVLKSFALTDMIQKIAEEAGVPCREIKIGFKWAVQGLVTGEALFAGEESGGYGYSWHLPERDGILSSLLLLELVATTGKPLSALVGELFARFGPHHYARRDLHLPNRLEIAARLAGNPPEALAGHRVQRIEDLDGLKLRFARGWLLLRASGTEPILRLYCEMDDPKEVRKVLDAAEDLVKGGLL
ncbi:MAG: phosphoglucomutase/phosphomannomutase family protein [Candidatus Bipolaricaulota bacterium]|nr:phosphoglucomutase/phosphomannomutase family protein [Candidatus Bipolaricaulota bacterium]MDW8151899.1 phosphoglucomutase/phosphomannomutase family protein [Candidatus Bipolaricaulota bacterium]